MQNLAIPLTDTPYNTLVSLKKNRIVHLHCPFVFHLDGNPINPDRVCSSFRRAVKRAGIENFRFHDLRHDFASSLVQRGHDLYIVQQLLGHKDGRMTQRYAHLKLETLRNAVESLEVGHKKGHSKNEKEVASYTTS
jgi:site-specific recombinase XerD